MSSHLFILCIQSLLTSVFNLYYLMYSNPFTRTLCLQTVLPYVFKTCFYLTLRMEEKVFSETFVPIHQEHGVTPTKQ